MAINNWPGETTTTTHLFIHHAYPEYVKVISISSTEVVTLIRTQTTAATTTTINRNKTKSFRWKLLINVLCHHHPHHNAAQRRKEAREEKKI